MNSEANGRTNFLGVLSAGGNDPLSDRCDCMYREL